MLNLLPIQTLALLSHLPTLTHTHIHNPTAVSRNPVSSLLPHHCRPRQWQQCSIRTKLLGGRGLAAKVLLYWNADTLIWKLAVTKKPARIHTSVDWNHLRNVRWDGTSSQRRHQTNGLNQPAWLGWELSWRGRGVWWEEEARDHLSPLRMPPLEFLPFSIQVAPLPIFNSILSLTTVLHFVSFP